jgi:4-alpha-glucanotransferase
VKGGETGVARKWGIYPGYHDFRGEYRPAAPSTIAAILDTMGADRGLPPRASVSVVIDSEPVELPATSTVRFEDGGEAGADDLPTRLPLGYHTVIERDGSERGLVVAPNTCFFPAGLHTWGWAVQLYALRSRTSWGIGDFGDLDRFGRWAASMGAGVVLLNPLHANKPGPQQPSPYFPSSRCFHDLLYLDLSEIVDTPSAARALNRVRSIDRDAVFSLKVAALQDAWAEFSDHERLDAYVAQRSPLLEDFATFNALAEAHGSRWSHWPSEYRHPHSHAVDRFRAANHDRVRFWCWVQWLVDRQLERTADGIGLIHDIAIGIDPEGADAWMWQDLLCTETTVGAPPDEFNRHGQDWASPPFDPHLLASHGYEPFIHTLRAAFAHGAGARIDHVMGLFRQYWIPEGSPATEGAYVRYPHRDLLSILALESHRAGSFVVGEDLGTVEPIVREEMGARNVLSYRIFWFESASTKDYPELSLAAVTNHDLPTVAGMWTGDDLAEQRSLGLEVDVEAHRRVLERLEKATGLDDNADVEDVIERVYEILAQAPSALVVATLEDALALTTRPNLPGTTNERPNWSLALPRTREEIEDGSLPRAIARALSSRRT